MFIMEKIPQILQTVEMIVQNQSSMSQVITEMKREQSLQTEEIKKLRLQLDQLQEEIQHLK